MQKLDNAVNSGKEYAKEAKNYAAGAVNAAESEYTEIADIRRDISSLKDNIAALTSHVKKDGQAKVGELKEAAAKRVDDIKAQSDLTLEKITEQVKANPRQAILIAFAAGLVTNFLLRSGR